MAAVVGLESGGRQVEPSPAGPLERLDKRLLIESAAPLFDFQDGPGDGRPETEYRHAVGAPPSHGFEQTDHDIIVDRVFAKRPFVLGHVHGRVSAEAVHGQPAVGAALVVRRTGFVPAAAYERRQIIDSHGPQESQRLPRVHSCPGLTRQPAAAKLELVVPNGGRRQGIRRDGQDDCPASRLGVHHALDRLQVGRGVADGVEREVQDPREFVAIRQDGRGHTSAGPRIAGDHAVRGALPIELVGPEHVKLESSVIVGPATGDREGDQQPGEREGARDAKASRPAWGELFSHAHPIKIVVRTENR